MGEHKYSYPGYSLTESYYQAMLDKGYTPGSADYYARLVKKVEAYMITNDIRRFSPTVARDFSEWWIETAKPSEALQKRMTVILKRIEQLNSEEEITFVLPRKEPVSLPEAIQKSIDEYRDYMLRYQNRASATVYNHTLALQNFFVSNGISSPRELSLSQIEKGYSHAQQKTIYKSAMNAYLSYLYREGYIKDDLKKSLPIILPSIPSRHPLPSVYTGDEINAILGAVDRTTVQGSRDFAILTIAASLGIRASDICEMTLERISFDNNEISFIQKKTSVPITLPLLPNVKEALVGYLQHRSIKSSKEPIFVQSRAPYRKLTHMGLWSIMRRYLEKSGVDPGHRKRGTHALRSSLASSMVDDQVPYHAVQEILGHDSPQATKSYVRIDVGRLRDFTIPAPEVKGSFSEFLKGGECNA